MTIYEAIAQIMNKGYAIAKEKENKQQNFKYRGIDDVMNTFQPLLAEHNVFVVPEVLEQTREERQSSKGNTLIYSILKMRYTFYSSDGTSVSAVVIGEGMDSGDKASNKAMAVAMKYAFFQVFCIPTEDMDDPDKESHEVKAKDAKKQPDFTKKKPSEVQCCELCGNPIEGYEFNGKYVSAEQHVRLSKKRFSDHAFCIDCINSGDAEEAIKEL